MNTPVSSIIYPVPKNFEQGGGYIDLKNRHWIAIRGNFSNAFLKHLMNFKLRISHLFNVPPEITMGSPGSGQIFIIIRQISGFHKEGYKLFSNENKIILEGEKEAGIYYGLKSLEQLLKATNGKLQNFKIEDYPSFQHRGIMLDISRCKVPTLQTLQRLIRLFSVLKINQLQLYMEHTFAFSSHKIVWNDSSPLSVEDILYLDAYCREHYVKLVPNFNSFGHFERWLRHPDYYHLAECPGGFTYEWGEVSPWGSTLKPTTESLTFLESLYREFLPNFSAPYFNTGCDETWELGKGFSKQSCEEKGTTNVYMEFLKKIHKMVSRYGKKMMFWGDIILKDPILLKNLPQNIIPLIWGYEGDHPFDRETSHFSKTGHSFYVCPGTSGWNSLTGRTVNCMENLKRASTAGHKNGAVGYLITDWGDKGHHQYLPVSYTGFAAGAGYAWNHSHTIGDEIAGVMDKFFFMDATGVLGELYYNLGKIHDPLPFKQPNESIINRLFFHNPASPIEIPPVPLLREALEKTVSLEKKLAGARSGPEDTKIPCEEFSNSCRMCRHAIRKALWLSGTKIKTSVLKQELEEIITAHKELWLKRNRIGGLEESCTSLKERLKDYEH